jgi:hypothetical protein
MNKQKIECVLLGVLMVQCTILQLFWNGRAYMEGLENFIRICQSLGALALHSFVCHNL